RGFVNRGFVAPRVAWRGAYRPVGWGPRYGWGYRPAYWGPRWRYGGYYPGYWRGYRSDGGAIAAGLIGGLALGAIINAATQPAYYPAYNNCFFERRRIVTRNGNVVVRRVRTCY